MKNIITIEKCRQCKNPNCERCARLDRDCKRCYNDNCVKCHFDYNQEDLYETNQDELREDLNLLSNQKKESIFVKLLNKLYYILLS